MLPKFASQHSAGHGNFGIGTRVCTPAGEGLDHGHADADPEARQPDALHGAVGAVLPWVSARRRRAASPSACTWPSSPPRPTTSRATPPRSCTCMCRRRGWPCSAMRWWRPPASACWCSAIRWPTSRPRLRRRSAPCSPFCACVTGSLWGKPMWGAFWVWDPRLTSVLILFFLYLGLIALRSSIEDESLAGKLTAVLALVGIVILPVIKFSVDWNSLHQPASVIAARRARHPPSLLWPLLVMAAGMTAAVRGACTSRRCATRSCAGASRRCAWSRSRPPAPALAQHGGVAPWTLDRTLPSSGRPMRSWRSCSPRWPRGWCFDGRRQQRLLDELEARGVRRRSPRTVAQPRRADAHAGADDCQRADRYALAALAPARLAAGDLLPSWR